MRRKDRELMPEEAWEIVDRCADGVVSMVDDAGAPYAVPEAGAGKPLLAGRFSRLHRPHRRVAHHRG